MRIIPVKDGVVVILGAVNPEQVTLFQNARSECRFLCREVNAVHAETRPGRRDVAHDGQTVDLRTGSARMICRLVEHVPDKARTVQRLNARGIERTVCAAAVAMRIAVVIADITCSQIVVGIWTVVIVVIHPFDVGIVINAKRFQKRPIARDRTAAVIGTIPACRVRPHRADVDTECQRGYHRGNSEENRQALFCFSYHQVCTASHHNYSNCITKILI